MTDPSCYELQRENDEMAEIIKSQNVHIEELTRATFAQHARLAAVEQLHTPGNIVDVWGKSLTMADDFQVCRECTDPDNWWTAWPCPTRKAARSE